MSCSFFCPCEKVAKKIEHPKYSVMIAAAIASFKIKGAVKGVSSPKILQYIMANYNVPENCSRFLSINLKRLVKNGFLVKNKASYKIAKKEVKPKPKKVVKKPKKEVKPKKVVKKTKAVKKEVKKRKVVTKPKKVVKKKVVKAKPKKVVKKPKVVKAKKVVKRRKT